MNDEIKNQATPESEATEQETKLATEGNNELTACKAERDSWKDKFLRVQADLDNVTKRNEKERLQWRTMAQGVLLTDLLPIIDDFDRAFEQAEKNATAMGIWLEGFEMIRKAFHKFLAKYEVQEIAATMPFDPEYHEAIMQVDAADKESGSIVAILQRGYMFKGQVLRPAKVSVAK